MTRRLRGVVVYKASKPTVRWHDLPRPASFKRAEHYLGLTRDADETARLVARLRTGKVEMRPAKDVLRATGMPPLPVTDPGVERQLLKIRAGARLRPILLAVSPNGTIVADGAHRLAATAHVDECAPVALVEATDGLSNTRTTKEATVAKRQKINKTNVQSARARVEIDRFADHLQRAYPDDPEVQGYASKGRALVQGPAVPSDGRGLSTATQDGRTTTAYATSGATKADKRLEESLGELTELQKREDLSPETRERVRTVSRSLQMAYLRKESPGAAAALEARSSQTQASNDAQHSGRQVPIVGDDAAIRSAAQTLQKADPNLSDYDALERAYRRARAA